MWSIYSKISDNYESGRPIKENTLSVLSQKLQNFGIKPDVGQELLERVTHDDCPERTVVSPGGILGAIFSGNKDVY